MDEGYLTGRWALLPKLLLAVPIVRQADTLSGPVGTVMPLFCFLLL